MSNSMSLVRCVMSRYAVDELVGFAVFEAKWEHFCCERGRKNRLEAPVEGCSFVG